MPIQGEARLQGKNTMTKFANVRIAVAAGACALALIGQAAPAAENPRVAAEIMELARSQWAAEIAGQTIDEQMVSVADDYTEFNPTWPTRIDGKTLSARLDGAALANQGSRSIVGDMLNPKVQVYGDTAILSYNFFGLEQDKDGKVKPTRAKSSRVYVKQGGQWMLVHANFGADPLPQ